MSAEQKPALRRIRTFAQDAAAASGKGTDINTKESNTTNTKVDKSVFVPTEKAAAAKVFATQAPHREPENAKPPVAVVPPHAEHIPAFHELQKKNASAEITVDAGHTIPKIPTPQEDPPKMVTVRTKKRDLNEKIPASGGTIITDTKRNKVNFFDSLLASIKEWLASFNKNLTTKKTPTYTVTDVERRKGVVQKATSKTGFIFTADNETLKEEIRRRNQTIAAAPHALDITWTPQTEPGFALLEEHQQIITAPVAPLPKPERIVVEFKKKSLPDPVITQPSTPELAIIPEIPEIPPEAESIVQAPISGYDSYTEASPIEAAYEPAPLEVLTTPAETIEESVPVSIEPLPTVQLQTVTSGNILGRFLETVRFNTNTLTLGIAGSVIAIIVVVVIARSLVGMIIPGHKDTTVPAASSLYSSSTVTNLSLPTLSQESLLETLKTVEIINSVPKEIRITGSTGIPLSTPEVLQLVGFGSSKNFIQASADVHVVTINAQHALVIKITDPTVALGSLLFWEPQMADGLHAYFGFTKPSLQTSFGDGTIAKHDVRILSADGKELIVYGFILANTILVTGDTASFKAVLGSH